MSKAWITKGSVIVGGEKFDENHYIDDIDGKEHSFVIGCYGNRYFDACQREDGMIVIHPIDVTKRSR